MQVTEYDTMITNIGLYLTILMLVVSVLTNVWQLVLLYQAEQEAEHHARVSGVICQQRDAIDIKWTKTRAELTDLSVKYSDLRWELRELVENADPLMPLNSIGQPTRP